MDYDQNKYNPRCEKADGTQTVQNLDDKIIIDLFRRGLFNVCTRKLNFADE